MPCLDLKSGILNLKCLHYAGVSLEAGYRWYTAVFVVTNLPLTAGYCGLIFTQAAFFD